MYPKTYSIYIRRTRGFRVSKNLTRTLLAIWDLGSPYVQKLKGDTAFDLGFGELICQKK